MPTRKSQSSKQSTPATDFPITLRPVEWYAYRSEQFPGYAFSGPTIDKALAHARSFIADYSKRRNLIPIIEIKESNDRD